MFASDRANTGWLDWCPESPSAAAGGPRRSIARRCVARCRRSRKRWGTGLASGLWPGASAHLERHTGIGFYDDRLRAILREEGFSFQRHKHTMKGKRDAAAYEKARRA